MTQTGKFKTIALFAFMLMLVVPAFGQGGQGRGQGPGGQRRQFTEEDVKTRVDRMAQNLELTEEQTKKIKDYEVEVFKKNQVEFQKFQGDREAMREFMIEQREARNKKYKEIMSEGQYKKFETQQQQRRQEMQNRRQQQNPDQEGGETRQRGRGRG